MSFPISSAGDRQGTQANPIQSITSHPCCVLAPPLGQGFVSSLDMMYVTSQNERHWGWQRETQPYNRACGHRGPLTAVQMLLFFW